MVAYVVVGVVLTLLFVLTALAIYRKVGFSFSATFLKGISFQLKVDRPDSDSAGKPESKS
jgi:hypothetical protein